MSVSVEIIHPAGPGDTRGLEEALARLPIERVRRLALLGKTEGPATLNDFSRDLAIRACSEAIAARGGEALLRRSWYIFSVGCEGIATPTIFLLADLDEAGETSQQVPRLAFGAARSEPLPDAILGQRQHVIVAAETIRDAMADGQLDADQVRLVLIKSPVLKAAAAADLGIEHRRHAGSTASARGAAALGAALALGEFEAGALGTDPVGRKLDLYSLRTMAFSGTETDRIEAIVLGERIGAGGSWTISTTVLDDLLDVSAIAPLQERFAGGEGVVLFKAGIAADGRLRGRRTTVLGSDLAPDKQLRAAASGLVGAWFGGRDAFISAGAEHQGPLGACLCSAVISH